MGFHRQCSSKAERTSSAWNQQGVISQAVKRITNVMVEKNSRELNGRRRWPRRKSRWFEEENSGQPPLYILVRSEVRGRTRTTINMEKWA